MSQSDAYDLLRREREQRSIIQRIARIGFWELDLSTDVLQWSDEIYQHLGLDPATFQMTSESFLEWVHPEDVPRFLAAHRHAVEDNAPLDIEHRIVRPDGEIFYVRQRAEITRAEDGTPLSMAGTVQDVTEHRRVEISLRDSEERFRRLFAGASTGIAVTDAQSRFVQVNPAYCAMFGYAESELLGRTFMDITHPADQERNVSVNSQLLAGEIEHFTLEKRYVRKDGTIAWGRATVTAVHTAAHGPRQHIAIVEDITEQKLAQDAALTLSQRLSQTLENMSEAFYLLAPDWRFVYLNREAERAMRRPRHELEGQLVWDIFPETLQTIVYDEFMRAAESGEPTEFEVYYPPLDEWFEVHTHPSLQGLAVYFRVISERKSAAQALRASEERFRELAEAVEDVFWIRDAESGRILYTNPRYDSLFRHSRAELYADPTAYQRNIHPDDLLRLHTMLEKDRYSLDLVYRLLPPDAQPGDAPSGEAAGATNTAIRHIHIHTYPIFDAHGELVRSVGVARDITPLVEANARLRASEEQYRLLFDENPNPMWVFDQETWQFLAVNQAAITHYGYSEAEFLNMTLRDIREPAREPELVQTMTYSPSGEFTGLTQHCKRDGSLIDVQLRTNRLLFNGKVARLVLINDVTAQLEAETRIREQAELLDKARDAILVRDLDYRITYWNRSASELYGWSVEEALGQSVIDLIYRDTAQMEEATQAVLTTGEWIGELTQVNRRGEEMLIEGRWTLVRDKEGNPQAILTINADITERKRLEAQFMRAQRMESIGTLAGGIAHDLNNVLTPILLSVSLLKQRHNLKDDIRLLDMIENNAKRSADMVRQVLLFARGTEGQRISVNIGQTLREVVTLIRDTFEKNIRISSQAQDDLWPILGDPTQIHQLVMNLAVNARDAMPYGGLLEFSADNMSLDGQYVSMNPQARVGRYTRITVSDTGTGIPAPIRERIFEPFFTTKDVGAGTGLGLSTVQAIAKSHGGFVNLYSEEGRGTTFRIYLPAQEESSEAAPVTENVRLPRGDGQLILVVDDEDSVRSITRQTLEAYGYRALVAEDGADALAIYAQRAHEIDLVLTDMMMPIMDGYATIQALYRINSQVRIIAASGLAANGMIAKAATAGVRHFLQKPYTSQALLQKVNAILRESPT
ncbi:MAG: PAS domain S-box protein [Litorilinea sp.]